MRPKRRGAILISGRGSNMAALLDAARACDYPVHFALVVSNRPEAGGLDIACAAGVEAIAIDHKRYKTREGFEAALHEALTLARAEIVCSAGFLRLFTPAFVAAWHGRLLNIHPSLLPAFRGLHPHAQALKAGVRISGCTVHFVSAEMDAGPIIAQAAVPVLPGDDEESLSARILAAEHRLYPAAVRLVASGAVRLEGDRLMRSAEGGGGEAEVGAGAVLFSPPLQPQAANT